MDGPGFHPTVTPDAPSLSTMTMSTHSSSSQKPFDDALGLSAAYDQALKSLTEGGIPIGASLLVHSSSSESLPSNSPSSSTLDPSILKRSGPEPNADPGTCTVLAVGHNLRVQNGSAVMHGETAMLEAAGRLKADVYRRATLVS